MKKGWIYALVAAGLVAGARTSYSEPVTLDHLKNIASRFSYFLVLEANEEEPLRYIYADTRQHVHLYHVADERAVLNWESVELGSRASALFVGDLDKDGLEEFVIATTQGRILIYGGRDHELLWENLQDPFETIECMTSQNIDRDPQDELIFVANSFLYIYDSVYKTIEWQSQRNFSAKEIILANVDNDDQPEIILNTGFVIDSRFYNVEYEFEEGFGDRMQLLDINGDDIPEIIGETTDFTLRIYDVYAERELW
ncbi:MAG: hypothetical protein ACE5EO_07570 [Candidatus Krumholzibacteriia bacterium]